MDPLRCSSIVAKLEAAGLRVLKSAASEHHDVVWDRLPGRVLRAQVFYDERRLVEQLVCQHVLGVRVRSHTVRGLRWPVLLFEDKVVSLARALRLRCDERALARQLLLACHALSRHGRAWPPREFGVTVDDAFQLRVLCPDACDDPALARPSCASQDPVSRDSESFWRLGLLLFEILWRTSLRSQLARLLDGDLRPERVQQLFRESYGKTLAQLCFPEAAADPQAQEILELCARPGADSAETWSRLFAAAGVAAVQAGKEPYARHEPDIPMLMPRELVRGLQIAGKLDAASRVLTRPQCQRHDPRAVLALLFRCWYADDQDRAAVLQLAGLDLPSCESILADEAVVDLCLRSHVV